MTETDPLAFLNREQKTSRRIAQNFFTRKKEEYSNLGLPMQVMLKELATLGTHGGKWIRPSLVRLGVKLLNHRVTHQICRASLAVELMHRYILIHDDIVDQDMSRHGSATLQKFFQERYGLKFPRGIDVTYSLGNAMIGGDILSALNDQILLESGLKEEQMLNMFKGLKQEFVETAAGWIWETDLKHTPLVKCSLKQVNRVMLLVSAHYSVLWPLRLGEILAGRNLGDWVEEIEVYGKLVGLAFQIQDDILGIFGDQKETGKPVGNDLREGKKTLLVQYAYEQAKPAARKYLQASLNREIDMERLNKVRDIIRQTGAYSFAQNEALRYVRLGIGAIKRLQPANEEARTNLISLAEYLITRKN